MADWLTVTPTSGSGNSTISVRADVLNRFYNREETVTVTTGSGIQKTITVSQIADFGFGVVVLSDNWTIVNNHSSESLKLNSGPLCTIAFKNYNIGVPYYAVTDNISQQTVSPKSDITVPGLGQSFPVTSSYYEEGDEIMEVTIYIEALPVASDFSIYSLGKDAEQCLTVNNVPIPLKIYTDINPIGNNSISIKRPDKSPLFTLHKNDNITFKGFTIGYNIQ